MKEVLANCLIRSEKEKELGSYNLSFSVYFN